MKPFVLLLMLFTLQGCFSQSINKRIVSELDLTRYVGEWYEIARLPNRFERGLVGVKANYSFCDKGKIRVVNSGYRETLEGEYTEAIGRAKRPNPSQPGRLKVAFFWCFYAPYWVLELDADYRWAVVGSRADKYLWILSRTPQLPAQRLEMLLQRIQERGYDTTKLYYPPQREL